MTLSCPMLDVSFTRPNELDKSYPACARVLAISISVLLNYVAHGLEIATRYHEYDLTETDIN